MEKPAPITDRFERYRPTVSRDATATRYQERMIARGIPVIRDAVDESDTPVWRGDHSFSSDAASYSLTHFIEPEIVKEHPDWGAEKIQTEARERFTKRLAQDLSYEKRESHHEETVVHWIPVETADGTTELATQYGDRLITLRELWEHTREYAAYVGNPDAYNPQEERAQMNMQDAFVRGEATGFVSVLSHPDAVRYVQVWEKNADGDVTSKQVDLFAATGRDFTYQESEQLIRHIAELHEISVQHDQREEQSYASFLVEYGRVNEQSIRVVATGFVMQQEYVRESAPFNTHPESGHQNFLIHDPLISMTEAGKFLHETIVEKLRVFTDHETNNIKEKHVSRQQHADNPHIHLPKDGKIHAVITKRDTIPPATDRYTTDSPESTIRNAMAEWFISQTIVRYHDAIPSGAHAALYWFALLERQTDTELSAAPAPPQESVSRHVFTEVLHARFEHMRTFVGKRLLQVFLGKPTIAKQPASPDGMPESAAVMASDKKRLNPMRAKEALQRFVHVVRDRLAELIRPLMHTNADRPRGPVSASKASVEYTPPADTTHADIVVPEDLGRALVVWRLFFGQTAVPIRRVDMRSRVMARFRRLFPRRSEKIPDTPVNTESAWVLAAIIRYLSLLRESGFSGQPVTTTGKRAKRKRGVSRDWHVSQSVLPGFVRTIMFTFAS